MGHVFDMKALFHKYNPGQKYYFLRFTQTYTYNFQSLARTEKAKKTAYNRERGRKRVVGVASASDGQPLELLRVKITRIIATILQFCASPGDRTCKAPEPKSCRKLGKLPAV